MNNNGRHVLFIPGLYPRGSQPLQHFAYKTALNIWQKDGFPVKICQFGWNEKQSFAKRRQDLIKQVTVLPGKVYIIGASAGGLAALSLLDTLSQKILSVATIASPLIVSEQEFNAIKGNLLVPIPQILHETYRHVDNILRSAPPKVLAKIISIYGQHDKRVAPKLSMRQGITQYALPVSGHNRIILSALSSHRNAVQALLQA